MKNIVRHVTACYTNLNLFLTLIMQNDEIDFYYFYIVGNSINFFLRVILMMRKFGKHTRKPACYLIIRATPWMERKNFKISSLHYQNL